MEKTSIRFHSSDKSEIENTIEVRSNIDNEVYIHITSTDEYSNDFSWICLDIHTAVKFSKELRRAIAQIKDAI